MAYEELQTLGNLGATETIGFDRLRSSGGDGYLNSALIGSASGLRQWTLKFNALSAKGNKLISTNRGNLTEADYLWDFYCRHQISGAPFIVKSPRSHQLYLAEFADESLSYEFLTHKLFTVGVKLAQRRVRGKSVFDVKALQPAIWYAADRQNAANDSAVAQLTDFSGNNRHAAALDATAANQPTFRVDAANNLPGFVWAAGNASCGFRRSGLLTFRHGFIVAKYNAAAFAGFAGLLTDANSIAVLVGADGQTKFFNNNHGSFGEFEYRKNHQIFTEANQSAPMNALAVISFRFSTGFNLAAVQIGQDRADAARRFSGVVAEAVLLDRQLTDSEAAEAAEHFLTKYSI